MWKITSFFLTLKVLIAVNFAIVSNKQELRKGTVSGLPVPPAHYRFQSPYNDKCVKAVYTCVRTEIIKFGTLTQDIVRVSVDSDIYTYIHRYFKALSLI